MFLTKVSLMEAAVSLNLTSVTSITAANYLFKVNTKP